jgi:hypothetical protein
MRHDAYDAEEARPYRASVARRAARTGEDNASRITHEENVMSNTKRSSFLIGTMVIVGFGLAMPAAHAFDPQPDPPANNRLDTKSKTNVVAPGLLDNGPRLSTNGPSATGTPVGAGGAAVGGPRAGGAAGIK